MPSRYSKTLEKLAANDPRIQEYEYLGDGEDTPHWLHLHSGWLSGMGSHICNGATVRECLSELRGVAFDPNDPDLLADQARANREQLARAER